MITTTTPTMRPHSQRSLVDCPYHAGSEMTLLFTPEASAVPFPLKVRVVKAFTPFTTAQTLIVDSHHHTLPRQFTIKFADPRFSAPDLHAKGYQSPWSTTHDAAFAAGLRGVKHGATPNFWKRLGGVQRPWANRPFVEDDDLRGGRDGSRRWTTGTGSPTRSTGSFRCTESCARSKAPTSPCCTAPALSPSPPPILGPSSRARQRDMHGFHRRPVPGPPHRRRHLRGRCPACLAPHPRRAAQNPPARGPPPRRRGAEHPPAARHAVSSLSRRWRGGDAAAGRARGCRSSARPTGWGWHGGSCGRLMAQSVATADGIPDVLAGLWLWVGESYDRRAAA
ncbi:hypothetical protein BV25DRAFT_624469 [Artomyces pyxidatus]|uniref:Uncharacterized protein n=1 Tax=Artomyces pyxidatus TaxID=48021 RepID=A0ACB8SDL6_9AGAM|nr:hypothetical protein BV25DRAFT_624469 [Artomyces pyxidatus]